MISKDFIITPDKAAIFPPELAGGKGANLDELIRAGMFVPNWYCISTSFMEEVFDSRGLFEKIDEYCIDLHKDAEPQFIEERVATIQSAIMKLDFTDEQVQFITTGHDNFFKADEYFSVRSSAVDEDRSGASFAGLHDSFLYIQGHEGLVDHIKKVWASTFNTRALVFRLEHNISTDHITIAVIVQKMVEARVSGIMFTANPNNGNVQELMISSLYGAGEGIVSAGLDADLFTFSKMTGEIRADISPKTTQFVFDKTNKSGVEKIDVPEELQDVKSLKDEHVKDIAAKGILIENHFGKPQDIEFSIDSTGVLFILQSRPITTLKEYGPAAGNRMIWDNSNIIESYSGPTTPMTFSFIRRAYTIVYHCFAEVMGISPKKVKESKHVFENMLGLFQGQVYYNIINWCRLVRMFPGFHFNKAFMESMMGVKEKVEFQEFSEPNMGGFRKYFVELPDLVSLLLRSIYNFARIDKLVAEFRRNFDTHYASWSAIDFSTKAPHDLMLLYRHMEDKLLWNWKTPIINDFYVMIFYGALKRCCTAWCDDESGSLQNELICGEGDIESTQPTKMLMEIARQIKENPKEMDFFNRHSHEELVRFVPESREHSEIAQLVDEYLDKYGFRCINELKLEEPSMRETPQFVYQVIKNYLKMEDKALDPELQEKREKEIRHLAEQKAAAELSGGFNLIPRKVIFQWVLRNARKGVKNRENMRFARTKIYGLLRELINALGDKFAHENIIGKGHDIYYLSIDEVWDYIKGTAITSNIDGLIQLRKKEFSLYNSPETTPIADHFETYGMAYHHNLYKDHTTVEETSGNGGLKGIGCCPGQVTQKIKIVESPRSDLSLKGEILVAARTDPGWVPLYPAVSGILIERGSILSHSAIVAREMGIPTIVGIPNLLTTLQDGQTVTMDGKTGIVTVDS